MALGIGKRIKQKRTELGLTQMELALKMGYTSKAAICKVEKGDDNITTDRVRKFAKALNVTEAWLMGWDDSPNSDMISMLENEKNQGDVKAQAFYDAIDPNFQELTDVDEYILLRAYRDATPEQKRMLIEMCSFFKSQKQD